MKFIYNNIKRSFIGVYHPLIFISLIVIFLNITLNCCDFCTYCDDGTTSYNAYASDIDLIPINSEGISSEQSPRDVSHNDNLSVNDYNVNCLSAYSNQQNVFRRRLYWLLVEKQKGKFNTYKDFKPSWDPNSKILSEIKKELNQDINLSMNKLKLFKRTAVWIINPGSRRGR